MYLTTNDSAFRIETLEIIQQTLEEQLDINVEIRVYSWDLFVAGQLLPNLYCDPPYEVPPPPGEPQWVPSGYGYDVPYGWDMTLVGITGGGLDPAWGIFETGSVLNLGGYSNPAYDDIGTQLNSLEIDWNVPDGSLDTLDPEARDLLFALQVQFYQNPPALNLVSRSPYTGPWSRYSTYLFFNLNNPYLTKALRREIRDVIPEDEILLLLPPDQGWGATSTFMNYGSPYLDSKFLPGGVFEP